MQNNHQHAAPTQHNKQSGRPRYDMQSQQQYNPQRFNRPQGGGNMPRQPHPGLSQVGQQQQPAQVVQVPGVQAHPQQIPQQPARVQQPQLTPPQYGVYSAGVQFVSYPQTQLGQPVAPQQLRIAYPSGAPTYIQTPTYGYNHLQQWQVAQATQQQLQNQAAAHQQYYQQMQQHQGVQHMQPILSGGQQYYAVRAQPTFVPGPSLQQSSAPPQPLPVQSQPAHQTHHVQHQQSQANPNVGILQVNPVQQQPEQRENVQPPPQRKKNRLQIVDPATGKSVFDDVNDAPPVSPAAEVDSAAQPADASNEEPAVVSLNSISSPTTVGTPQASPNPSYAEETKPIEEKEKVRSEFFQKITKLGDETNVPSRGDTQPSAQPAPSTTTSSTTTELSTPPSPTPPPSTEQESVIKVESATAQAQDEESAQDADKVDSNEPITVSLNGTSGSIQESSLCSISPTPIEKYVDPSSPEVPTVSADASSVSSPMTEGVETKERARTPDVPDRQETPLSEALSPETEGKDNVPVVSYNSTLDSTSEEERLVERIQELTLSDEVKPVETETLPNGKGEAVDDEHLDEEGGPESTEEGEINDTEDTTAQGSSVKRRIMYDREQLLAYKQNKDLHLDMQIPPDLIKDPSRSNSSQHGNYNFAGSPLGPPPRMGGRSGMQPMRSGRGGPMTGMQPNRSMGWMGPMGAGGPFQVPPPLHAPRAPKIIELHREKVELHKAENAWKPSMAVRGKGKNNEEVDEEQLIQEDVVKKTRSILNKLTPENFDKLVNKFLQLKLEDKDDRIQKVIHVVFEKAVDEPSFSAAYAQMVRTVCDKSQETAKKFRKQILDQCQREFQKGSSEEEEIKRLEEELTTAEDAKKDAIKLDIEDKKYATRRRALGNVRFIGELYKLQMLTPKIMIECIGMLLVTQDEESLECLCKLLSTVGQRLEQNLADTEARGRESISKGLAPKFMPEPKYMDKTFANLKLLSSSNKLSSRIRFALLDVYELRENDWKPRRDTTGPKKIDEVRRDAVRQEQEEKRQLQNLPPPQPMSRQPPQQKKGDWSTVQSNKSSRFAAAMKKPPGEQAGPTGLLLGPQGGPWNRGPMSQGLPKPESRVLPPRLMNNNSNKFSALSPEERTPFRHEIVQPAPPSIRTTPVTGSLPTSRESSRPQTPSRDQPPPPVEEDENANLDEREREIVKNIFEEFMNFRKTDETLDWIESRFKGRKIYSFIEEISRLVSDMSKEDQQKTAGSLLNTLIRKGLVSKNEVIKTLKDGVISDLYDIAVDVPKVTSYIAVFLVELFIDESDLFWLLEFESVFEEENEDAWQVWKSLIADTLNILKLRRNEEAVQHLFKQTKGADRFPIEDIPWVSGETVDSLSKKMIKVLEEEYPKQKDFNICSEQFDLRNELTSKSLIQALCVVCWKEKEQEWNIPYFEEVLVQSRLPIVRDHLPFLWKQAMEFITANKIDKANEEKLWSLMNRLNLVDPSHERDPA